MVDQLLGPLDEAYGVRQGCVQIECCLIHPSRVDQEEQRIARGAKPVKVQAAGLPARRLDHRADGLLKLVLSTGACVKPAEDEELHCYSTMAQYLGRLPRAISRVTQAMIGVPISVGSNHAHGDSTPRVPLRASQFTTNIAVVIAV